jgi:signal transduction histidine kinase
MLARWWSGLLTSRREAMFDVLLMMLVMAFLVLLLLPMVHRHGSAGLLVQLGTTVLLLFRRTAPLSALLLILASTIGLVAVAQYAPSLLAGMLDVRGNWIVVAAPFVAYSAMVYGSDRRRAWLLTCVITLIAARPWQPTIELAGGSVMVVLLPALLGHYVASLNERVERAERDQHRLAEQARVEERVRLAAEMHDVVTHRISLMVLQAGALGVTAADPATRAAAEDLRAAGCQALEELRDLVGVLRSTPGEVTEDLAVPRAGGQAVAPDFSELLAESESVGVCVRLEQEGDASIVSPVVARTVYRIVQESLTNVRKHAPGATALVRLRYGADRVRLTIRNTPPEQHGDDGLTASGSGTGLLGLRQRVELVSGTLRTGHTEEGGFEVHASLPAFVPTRDDEALTRGRSGRSARPEDHRAVADGMLTRVRGRG